VFLTDYGRNFSAERASKRQAMQELERLADSSDGSLKAGSSPKRRREKEDYENQRAEQSAPTLARPFGP
jgi:hypothetical protein